MPRIDATGEDQAKAVGLARMRETSVERASASRLCMSDRLRKGSGESGRSHDGAEQTYQLLQRLVSHCRLSATRLFG